MAQWLRHASDSVLAYQNHHPARMSAELQGFSSADQLAIVNVAVQVERLTRHPMLAEAVQAGRVRVVGMFFDIGAAHVYEIDEYGILGQGEASRAGVRGGHRRDGNRSLW